MNTEDIINTPNLYAYLHKNGEYLPLIKKYKSFSMMAAVPVISTCIEPLNLGNRETLSRIILLSEVPIDTPLGKQLNYLEQIKNDIDNYYLIHKHLAIPINRIARKINTSKFMLNVVIPDTSNPQVSIPLAHITTRIKPTSYIAEHHPEYLI